MRRRSSFPRSRGDVTYEYQEGYPVDGNRMVYNPARRYERGRMPPSPGPGSGYGSGSDSGEEYEGGGGSRGFVGPMAMPPHAYGGVGMPYPQAQPYPPAAGMAQAQPYYQHANAMGQPLVYAYAQPVQYAYAPQTYAAAAAPHVAQQQQQQQYYHQYGQPVYTAGNAAHYSNYYYRNGEREGGGFMHKVKRMFGVNGESDERGRGYGGSPVTVITNGRHRSIYTGSSRSRKRGRSH